MQKIIPILFLVALASGLAGCASSYPGGTSPEGIAAPFDPWSGPVGIQEEMSRVTRSLIP